MINEHINKCPGLQQKTFQSIFIRTVITSSWCFPFNTIWSQKECSVILTNISPHYLITFDQEGVFSTQALPMLTGGCGLAKQVFLLRHFVSVRASDRRDNCRGRWGRSTLSVLLQQDSNPPLSPTSNPSGWLLFCFLRLQRRSPCKHPCMRRQSGAGQRRRKRSKVEGLMSARCCTESIQAPVCLSQDWAAARERLSQLALLPGLQLVDLSLALPCLRLHHFNFFCRCQTV